MPSTPRRAASAISAGLVTVAHASEPTACNCAISLRVKHPNVEETTAGAASRTRANFSA